MVSTNFVSFMKQKEKEIAKELSATATTVDNVKEEGNAFLNFLGDVGSGATKVGKGLLDFLILDDVNTLADKDASLLDKGIALASFIPIGKVLKIPKAIDKIVDSNVDEVLGKGIISNNDKSYSRIEYLHKKYGQFTPNELNHRINLRGAVEKEVERLNTAGLTKNELGPAVAGTFDKTNGKYYFGINNTDGDIPTTLHPIIRDRIYNMPSSVKDGYKFTYGAGSHAEVYSLNQALLANPNARPTDFITHVVRSGKKLNQLV